MIARSSASRLNNHIVLYVAWQMRVAGIPLRKAGPRTREAITRMTRYISKLIDDKAEKNMITPVEAAQLRILITEYRDAEIADSFKGAGDPADWDQITTERDNAKRELELFIHVLEHGTSSTPIELEAPK